MVLCTSFKETWKTPMMTNGSTRSGMLSPAAIIEGIFAGVGQPTQSSLKCQ